MNVIQTAPVAAMPDARLEPANGRHVGTRRAYCYRHRVSFEDTNLVGNVYFAHYLSWQGRCRELFLLEHAPGVLAALEGSLRLVTLNVACEYFAELQALDEIEIAMMLVHQRQHRIKLAFDYRLIGRIAKEPMNREAGGARAGSAGPISGSAITLAARGTQEVGCMQHTADGLIPYPVPIELASALDAFR
jgi:enediyne biosynthesis thioesterase